MLAVDSPHPALRLTRLVHNRKFGCERGRPRLFQKVDGEILRQTAPIHGERFASELRFPGDVDLAHRTHVELDKGRLVLSGQHSPRTVAPLRR